MKIAAILFITLVGILTGPYHAVIPQESQVSKCGPSVNERLQNYFSVSSYTPTLVINNTEYPPTPKSGRSVINVGQHRVEWISKVDKPPYESSISINGHLIPLNKVSAFIPFWEDYDVGLATGRWDQIKLFKFGNREIIGVTMSPETCTGLSCSAASHLIYDVRTKAKSFFGTFKVDRELQLFGFGNDPNPSYISKTFEGDQHMQDAYSVTYKIFTMQANGVFSPRADENRQPYYLKHKSNPNSSTKADTLEQHWIERIE